jgi:hypothetical protein
MSTDATAANGWSRGGGTVRRGTSVPQTESAPQAGAAWQQQQQQQHNAQAEWDARAADTGYGGNVEATTNMRSMESAAGEAEYGESAGMMHAAAQHQQQMDGWGAGPGLWGGWEQQRWMHQVSQTPDPPKYGVWDERGIWRPHPAGQKRQSGQQQPGPAQIQQQPYPPEGSGHMGAYPHYPAYMPMHPDAAYLDPAMQSYRQATQQGMMPPPASQYPPSHSHAYPQAPMAYMPPYYHAYAAPGYVGPPAYPHPYGYAMPAHHMTPPPQAIMQQQRAQQQQQQQQHHPNKQQQVKQQPIQPSTTAAGSVAKATDAPAKPAGADAAHNDDGVPAPVKSKWSDMLKTPKKPATRCLPCPLFINVLCCVC